jgi:TonB-dependent receptor
LINIYYKKRFTSAFILISLFLFQSLIIAQTGTLKGRVLDKNTKTPLVFANVVVKGTNNGAATDANGEFIIRNITAGSQILTISYLGYISYDFNVTVTSNENKKEDYYLEGKVVEGQTVVITAQAEGQLSAINQERSSNTIENIVAKDRIKELPDVNAAESIGRLPGISIERSGGEANKVEVRGLDPKYSLVSVNGVTVPGSGANDRSVDLSLISSNMLDGISVKKVVTADMDATVLGGTIDLKLKEAPDSFVVNASGQWGYNQLQNYKKNYNFNLSVSNRFFDNLLGIIANVNADNYDRSADKLNGNYATTFANGYRQTIIQELTLREEVVNQKRLGASLLMDYLIPMGKMTGNFFFNQRKSDYTFYLNDFWTPNAPYNTNRIYQNLEQSKNTTSIYTGALGILQDFEWIKYDFTFSKAGSLGDTPDDRVWNFHQEGTAAFTDPINPGFPYVKIPKIAVYDTNRTQLAEMYIYSKRVMENHTTTQFNVSIPVQFNDEINGTIKTGAKFHWLGRSNNEEQWGENGINYGNGNTSNSILTALNRGFPSMKIDSLSKFWGGLPINQFLLSGTRSNFLNGDFAQGFRINPYLMNLLTNYLKTTGSSTWLHYSIGSLGKDYSGSEAYQAGYLMGQFNITKYVIFIPGIRWEGEHTAYNGLRYRQMNINNQEGPPADLTYLSTVRNNSFWLPMVNVIVRPNDWLQIKLARTETLAHPDYLQYAPITYISSDQSQITAANSQLKTSHSTNYDAEVSVYQNYVGYFSTQVFQKDIKDLIFWASSKLMTGLKPADGLNIPPSWYSGSTPTVSTYMNNPNSAKYYGIELDWNTHFWYLPSVLSGLILDVNFTHIYSEMYLQYDSLVKKQIDKFHAVYSFDKRQIKTRMPDQPSNIANITLGYDYEGFSARLSYIYMADKLSGIGYSGTYPTPVISTYSGAYHRWDLSLQQKFTGNFVVFLNLNNLNKEPDQTFVGSDLKNPSYLEYYGFSLDLGIRYNL